MSRYIRSRPRDRQYLRASFSTARIRSFLLFLLHFRAGRGGGAKDSNGRRKSNRVKHVDATGADTSGLDQEGDTDLIIWIYRDSPSNRKDPGRMPAQQPLSQSSYYAVDVEKGYTICPELES